MFTPTRTYYCTLRLPTMGSRTAGLLLMLSLMMSCTLNSATAQDCSTGATFTTADLNGVIYDVAGNHFQPPEADPMTMAPSATIFFSYQSSMICLRNSLGSILHPATFTLAQVADAATAVQSKCCPGSTCQGGTNTINVDSAPPVSMFVTTSAVKCSSL